MNKMNDINYILKFIDELYQDAHCELEYSKDYELLLAIVMSAQTTDKMVNKVTKVLFGRYKTINELADVSLEDIENIIRIIGTHKKKSQYIKDICNRLVSDCNGKVPNDRDYLMTLPGVGRKTINVFLSEYYKEPFLAVDTHVERVSKRLNLASDNDNVLEVEKKLVSIIPSDRLIKAHHQFIFFGRYFCKSRNPNCSDCKLYNICKYYKNKETKK